MIKPLKNYVLLKKVENESKETKVGSIFIQVKDKDNSVNVGEVLDLGNEVKDTLINKGDKVIYKEYSTTSYKENDVEYLLLKDIDILAIIK